MALVVPALVAEDLASKPVGHHTVINPDTGLRAGLRVHVTKALRPNWFSMKDRVGWVDGNPMPSIAAAVKKKSRKLPRYRQDVGLDDIHLLLVSES